MLQVANIHTAKVNKFVRKMKTDRLEGQDTNETSISVENCLKFVRSDNGDETTTEPTTPNPTIMKCFKVINGVKKSVSMKQNYEVKTDMSSTEIEMIITSLKQIVVNNQCSN